MNLTQIYSCRLRFPERPSEGLALFLFATDFRRKGKAELSVGVWFFVVFLIIIFIYHCSCVFNFDLPQPSVCCIYHSTER